MFKLYFDPGFWVGSDFQTELGLRVVESDFYSGWFLEFLFESIIQNGWGLRVGLKTDLVFGLCHRFGIVSSFWDWVRLSISLPILWPKNFADSLPSQKRFSIFNTILKKIEKEASNFESGGGDALLVWKWARRMETCGV